MITAAPRRRTCSGAARHGVDAYLTKPFEPANWIIVRRYWAGRPSPPADGRPAETRWRHTRDAHLGCAGDTRRALQRSRLRRPSRRRCRRADRAGTQHSDRRATQEQGSTATTPPTSRCSSPSPPARLRARSPRSSPRACGRPRASRVSTSPARVSSTSRLRPPRRGSSPARSCSAGTGVRPQQRARQAAHQPGVRLRQPDRPDPHRRGALGGGRRLSGPDPARLGRRCRHRVLHQRRGRADRQVRRLAPGGRERRPVPEDGYVGEYVEDVARQILDDASRPARHARATSSSPSSGRPGSTL